MTSRNLVPVNDSNSRYWTWIFLDFRKNWYVCVCVPESYWKKRKMPFWTFLTITVGNPTQIVTGQSWVVKSMSLVNIFLNFHNFKKKLFWFFPSGDGRFYYIMYANCALFTTRTLTQTPVQYSLKKQKKKNMHLSSTFIPNDLISHFPIFIVSDVLHDTISSVGQPVLLMVSWTSETVYRLLFETKNLRFFFASWPTYVLVDSVLSCRYRYN